MKKNVVLKASKDTKNHGVIVHELSNGETMKYTTVRGGISWPTNSSHGFCCAVGQLWNGNPGRMGQKQRKGGLVLLDEYKSNSMSLRQFFTGITDLASMYFCGNYSAKKNQEVVKKDLTRF